jgi:hypothetical protein
MELVIPGEFLLLDDAESISFVVFHLGDSLQPDDVYAKPTAAIFIFIFLFFELISLVEFDWLDVLPEMFHAIEVALDLANSYGLLHFGFNFSWIDLIM